MCTLGLCKVCFNVSCQTCRQSVCRAAQAAARRCSAPGVRRVSQGRRAMRHHRAVGLLPRSEFILRSMFITEGPLPCSARQPCPGSELTQVAGA